MLPEVVVELDWRNKRYRDIERGLRAVGDDFERDLEALTPIVRKLLMQYMEGVVLSVAARTGTPWPQGTSPKGQFPGTLSRRSGDLRSKLNPAFIKVTGNETSDLAVSFTLTGIAAVHEQGAVIKPKKAKYLTIPLPPALDSRGVPKKPSARDWADTFILRSKKGNLLIVQKGEGKGKITPLYVLKKSVVIPKRLAFQEAFESGRDMLADKIAAETIKEFFHGK